MGATRRKILAGLAAGDVASRAAAQKLTMIVPFQIPWDPEGLADGWPSSFVEYQLLTALLSQGEPSFDVVVPTQDSASPQWLYCPCS